MLGPLRDLTRVPNALLNTANTAVDAARDLRTLQQTVTERLASLDGQLRELVAVLPGVADDLRRVRATVEPQHERVASIEEGLARFSSVPIDVGAMRATIEPQHERVAAIEHGLEILPRLSADLAAVVATIEPQHERVAAIEEDVGQLNARLANLQRILTTLEGEVSEATDQLPDPDAAGPLTRARDALTGRS